MNENWQYELERTLTSCFAIDDIPKALSGDHHNNQGQKSNKHIANHAVWTHTACKKCLSKLAKRLSCLIKSRLFLVSSLRVLNQCDSRTWKILCRNPGDVCVVSLTCWKKNFEWSVPSKCPEEHLLQSETLGFFAFVGLYQTGASSRSQALAKFEMWLPLLNKPSSFPRARSAVCFLPTYRLVENKQNDSSCCNVLLSIRF